MPEPTVPEPARPARKLLVPVLIAAGLVLLIGAGAVLYGKPQPGKESAAACPGAAATVARLDPLVHGDIAALNLSRTPVPLDDLSFDAGDGTRKTLRDFRGRTVLLNLWATWCVPCRTEMPALAGPTFQVVAVNIDTAKLERPKQFMADAGIKALPFYADPTAKVFQTLRETAGIIGLPTSFLLDRNGCTLATLAGPADWASEDALRLIAATHT